MSYADDNPGYRIDSTEQAIKAMEEMILDVEEARRHCDTLMFGRAPQDIATEKVKKAHKIFLVKHGSALGSLAMLHRCAKLEDTGYMQLRERILKTLVPTSGEIVLPPGVRSIR